MPKAVLVMDMPESCDMWILQTIHSHQGMESERCIAMLQVLEMM